MEVGLDEEPEADEDGDDGYDGTKRHGQGARVLRVAPAQDEDGQAGRHVLGEARDDADGGQGREAARQGDEDADEGREEDGHVRRVEAVVAREDWRQHVVVGDGDDDARRQEGRGQVDAADGDERTGGDEQAAARAEEDGSCRRDRRLRLGEVRAEHADGHGHDEEIEGRDEQHDDDDGARDVAPRVIHILRGLGDGLEAREGVEDQERGRAERESPRQIPRMGRPRRLAAAMSSRSNVSRTGSVLPSFSCGSSPQSSGSTSQPPEMTRPSTASICASTISSSSVTGRIIGTPPAEATACT